MVSILLFIITLFLAVITFLITFSLIKINDFIEGIMDALFEIRKVPKRGKWHYRYNSGYRDYHYYGEEITSEILKGNKTICKKSGKNSKSNNKINSNGKGMEEYNKWVLYVIESNR